MNQLRIRSKQRWAVVLSLLSVATAMAFSCEDPKAAVRVEPKAPPSEPGQSSSPDSRNSAWAVGDPLNVDKKIVKVLPNDMIFDRAENAKFIGAEMNRTILWFVSTTNPDRYFSVSVNVGKDAKNWRSLYLDATEKLRKDALPHQAKPATRSAKLQGTDGLVAQEPTLLPYAEFATTAIWSPHPGVVLMVSGVNVTEDEILVIGEGISK